MTLAIDPTVHMWAVFGFVLVGMISFAVEKVSVEVTSLSVLVALLLWFQVFPYTDPTGDNMLDAVVLLRGFANPSLLAVLALLVIGQAMVQTGALTGLAGVFLRLSQRRKITSILACFAAVLVTSAFLNNTPVVVMFIPIMQLLAGRLNWSASRLMMPLSFAAMLGGMTTMIGSSTNMLVSSALTDLDQPILGLFDITMPALMLAGVGALYVGLILPRLLPHRAGLAGAFLSQGKQFVAEIDVTADSPLVGQSSVAGQFKSLPGVTVRLIQRRGQNILPPFDELSVQSGDMLIVAATRQALTEALTRNAGYMLTQHLRKEAGTTEAQARRPAERVLAEVMIAPASRMIDQSVDAVGFQRRYGCAVLGIQRRGRMARQRLGEIRLEAGDVLLIVGASGNIDNLSNNPDLLLMAWSTRDLPRPQRAPHATAVFATTVLLAGTGALPISVAAITGALAMLVFGCLNIRQASRALDRTIYVLVGAALAMGTALQVTGGAETLAMFLVESIAGRDPLTNMAVLFAVVAIATNILSNNACAVLFTPIAVSMAIDVGISPTAMAVTVILAANCAFATPIGYQTNLLVMGPGHYRFRDFLKGGAPLILVMWATFSLTAPLFFDL